MQTAPKRRAILFENSVQSGGWPTTSLPEHVALGKFHRGVSLLAWAYNEEALAPRFFERAIELLNRVVSDWEIVFVDDCSTDRTGEIAAAFAAREPRIRIVRHERNLNVGLAFRSAIAHASKEFLFWQTIDWSYDIGKLRVFLELLNDFDALQGIQRVSIWLLCFVPAVRYICRLHSRLYIFSMALISCGKFLM